jgi:hypothetical protein
MLNGMGACGGGAAGVDGTSSDMKHLAEARF